MDFELPEPIQVESKSGDRVILVRPSGDANQHVTIDFERRRWQLGNHPHRILNFVPTTYKGRNWKKEIVADAVRGLLASHQGSFQAEALALMNDVGSNSDKQPNLPVEEPLATTEPGPEFTTPAALPEPLLAVPAPEAAIIYAWKRLVDGKISQDINAPTPEALFQKAGFQPYRVLDPIQGFLCVPVEWRGGRWTETARPS
jgi:hypothetical protein